MTPSEREAIEGLIIVWRMQASSAVVAAASFKRKSNMQSPELLAEAKLLQQCADELEAILTTAQKANT